MDEYSADSLDYTFGALSHPVRRKMIELLSVDAVRVTDLAARFDCSLNVVSKHIQSLERAGMVVRNKKGRVHELSFNSKPLAEAASFIERYRDRWGRKMDRLAGYMDQVAKQRQKENK